MPVARVRAGDFLRARSLRLEHGPDDPRSFFDGWFDVAAIRREVLDPMRPPADSVGAQPADPAHGQRSWLPGLRDPATDRPYRQPPQWAVPTTVLVLDGMFLGRPELAEAIDVLVHLDVSPSARARRVPVDAQARVLPAWEHYRRSCAPAARADAVVRYDRPTHPAIRLASG